jgi:hypothetical protein
MQDGHFARPAIKQWVLIWTGWYGNSLKGVSYSPSLVVKIVEGDTLKGCLSGAPNNTSLKDWILTEAARREGKIQ